MFVYLYSHRGVGTKQGGGNKQAGRYFLENVEEVEVHIYVNGINEEGGIFARREAKP